MRHLAAYLLLVVGGNAAPTAEDVKALLGVAGIDGEEERLTQLLADLEGKDLNELIALGKEKLVVAGGVAVAAGPAAAGAPASVASVVAPAASQLQQTAASGAESLQKVSEPAATQAVAQASEAVASTSAAVEAAAPATNEVVEVAEGAALNASADIAAVASEVSSEIKGEPGAVTVHIDPKDFAAPPAAAAAPAQAAAPETRVQSPIVVNPDDPLHKQQLDTAANEVRKLKAEHRPQAEVKVAVDAFIAARSVHQAAVAAAAASSTTETQSEAEATAASNGAAPAAAEKPAEKPAEQKTGKGAKQEAAAQVSKAKQSGNKGRGKRGGN